MEELGEMLPESGSGMRTRNGAKTKKIICFLLIGSVIVVTAATVGIFAAWGNFSDPYTSAELTQVQLSCTYKEHDLYNLSSLLAKSSKYLAAALQDEFHYNGTSEDNPFSTWVLADTEDKCQEDFNGIQKQLISVTVEAIVLNSVETYTLKDAEALKGLEIDSEQLEGKLQTLIRRHSWEPNGVQGKYNTAVAKYRNRMGNVLEKLKNKVYRDDIVRAITSGTMEDAVEKLNSFEDEPEIISENLKEVIRYVWELSKERTLEFVEKLVPLQKAVAYKEILLQMSPLERSDAEILLKIAYKIREEIQKDEDIYSPLKYMLPETIKNLMWHESCTIQNKKSAHYMKIAEMEGKGECMTGDNELEFLSDQEYKWKLIPFQEAAHSPVLFRIENVDKFKYLTVSNGTGPIFVDKNSPMDNDTMWEIKFPESKVGSVDDTFAFVAYIRSHHLSQYLYEKESDWDDFGHTESECVQLSEKERVYDEGKWIFHFGSYHFEDGAVFSRSGSSASAILNGACLKILIGVALLCSFLCAVKICRDKNLVAQHCRRSSQSVNQ